MKVGALNDKYEQEADAMADKVVSMPTPQSPTPEVQHKCAVCQQEELSAGATVKEEAQTKPLASLITPLVQRQEEEKEEPTQTNLQRQEEEKEEPAQTKLIQRQEEEKEEPAQAKLLQRQEEEKEEDTQTKRIQRKVDSEPSVGPSIESRLNGSKGGGSPLPNDTRNFMESRFGTDFSSVKVHTDSNAIQMNKELNAQAFAHGNDVYFNKGKYNPSSNTGKHLLAHELTHVVQQDSNLQLSVLSTQKDDTNNLKNKDSEIAPPILKTLKIILKKIRVLIFKKRKGITHSDINAEYLKSLNPKNS